MIDAAVDDLAPLIGELAACRALGACRSSRHRRKHPPAPRPARPRQTPDRALSEAERDGVLAQLHSPRFVDASPAEVYATLLDEGVYLASERTMYRLLAAHGENGERRDQRTHPPYQRPELLASAPNELWSWDISKLLGPAKWTYFYLYAILDVHSRYIVGWTVQHRESAVLAKALIADTIQKQQIPDGRLTIHADRGSSMTSKPVAFLLADLGVTKTHSRPYTSTDNPYSESGFKTLKYRPSFPARFDNILQAREHLRAFVHWYNNVHCHSGIGLMTPATVHHGLAEQTHAARAGVLDAAYASTPERFVRRPPTPPSLPGPAWINKPAENPSPAAPAREEAAH
jgi:putative transposase